jgi:DNA-directed RNA polymerase specialized sigma subunit
MVSAIDAFLGIEKDANSSSDRAAKDKELWEQWNEAGRTPSAMRPLLKEFKPLIHKRAGVYAGKNPNVPPEAVRAEFMNNAITAFENYDPNRGAALGTHVNWQLMKSRRFIATYGSGSGRIPENRSYKVQEFKNAKFELQDSLGREPSGMELANKLSWPLKQVSSMELELRREIPSSMFQADTMAIKPSRSAEVIRLIQYELTPEEQNVMEYTLGVNGKPQLKPGDIASKLNMSPSKVSRVKLEIAKKMGKYEL